MNTVIYTVLVSVWVMLPAYLPNNAAVLFAGYRPLDAGRTWRGKRILGDGKTWRGTLGGFLTGFVLAQILNAVSPGFLPDFTFVASISLPMGAVLGDIGASFVKRRTGRSRGESWPGVDQYDFVVGSWVITILAAPAWFNGVFTPPIILTVLLITPILHVTTNYLAYKLDLKDEPW